MTLILPYRTSEPRPKTVPVNSSQRVAECEKETARDLSLPWSQVKLAIFTNWRTQRQTVGNTLAR